MIRFNSNDEEVRNELSNNAEFAGFVRSGNVNGRILIQVDNVHVVLFHNVDDTFSSYLFPEELPALYDNIANIRKIAYIIQEMATDCYKKLSANKYQ